MYFLVRNYEEFTENKNLTKMSILSLRQYLIWGTSTISSLRPSDTYMRRETRQALLHWYRKWMGADQATSHHLNQDGNIVNWTLGNKLQWNFHRNSHIFIHANTFENFVWKRRPYFLRLNVLILHYNDVTMDAIASQITSLTITQTQIKENIKAPRYWPLCGEFTGDRWILRTNGQ